MKAFQLKLTREVGEDIELLAVADLDRATHVVRALDRLWQLEEDDDRLDLAVASSLRYELAVYGLADVAPVLDAWPSSRLGYLRYPGCGIQAVNVQEDRTYMLNSDDEWEQVYRETFPPYAWVST